MSELIKFRLEMTRSELEREEARASNGDGLTIEQVEAIDAQPESPLAEAQFVETVAVIAVASIAMIAKRLVDHWLRSKEQGVQIDLRKDPPVISQVANVPRGFLVIIDKDGKATPHQANYEKGDDLVPLLMQVLKS